MLGLQGMTQKKVPGAVHHGLFVQFQVQCKRDAFKLLHAVGPGQLQGCKALNKWEAKRRGRNLIAERPICFLHARLQAQPNREPVSCSTTSVIREGAG